LTSTAKISIDGFSHKEAQKAQNQQNFLSFSFLSGDELNYARQTSMKCSFNNFALDFLSKDWFTIRELLFQFREVQQQVRIFWTTSVPREL
jgi:hypothetical protein